MRSFVCAFVLVASAGAAFAAPVAPGGTLFLPAGEGDPVGGTQIGGAGTTFSTAYFSGSLLSMVISGDTSNPYGGLTFVYILSNDSTSINGLARLTVNGYAGFQTDMSWSTSSGGTRPFLIDRQATGDTVGFSFGNIGSPYSLIAPGTSATWLVVQTNATQYGYVGANVIDGATANVLTYGPIPTPGASALFAAGLIASARRRRA